MSRRLLDLGCGAGGASVGYSRLGFDVTGASHVGAALIQALAVAA